MLSAGFRITAAEVRGVRAAALSLSRTGGPRGCPCGSPGPGREASGCLMGLRHLPLGGLFPSLPSATGRKEHWDLGVDRTAAPSPPH